jgi:hypothetical protein
VVLALPIAAAGDRTVIFLPNSTSITTELINDFAFSAYNMMMHNHSARLIIYTPLFKLQKNKTEIL